MPSKLAPREADLPLVRGLARRAAAEGPERREVEHVAAAAAGERLPVGAARGLGLAAAHHLVVARDLLEEHAAGRARLDARRQHELVVRRRRRVHAEHDARQRRALRHLHARDLDVLGLTGALRRRARAEPLLVLVDRVAVLAVRARAVAALRAAVVAAVRAALRAPLAAVVRQPVDVVDALVAVAGRALGVRAGGQLPRRHGPPAAGRLVEVLVAAGVVRDLEGAPLERDAAAAVADAVAEAAVGHGAAGHPVAAVVLLDPLVADGALLADLRHGLLRRLVHLRLRELVLGAVVHGREPRELHGHAQRVPAHEGRVAVLVLAARRPRRRVLVAALEVLDADARRLARRHDRAAPGPRAVAERADALPDPGIDRPRRHGLRVARQLRLADEADRRAAGREADLLLADDFVAADLDDLAGLRREEPVAAVVRGAAEEGLAAVLEGLEHEAELEVLVEDAAPLEERERRVRDPARARAQALRVAARVRAARGAVGRELARVHHRA
mmetsp:Transcript_8105/g.27728  ORF Transcript_8105/g.27728 Transcript_8105/m.27728 type:complete len:503 (+) Transcript_8105:32-1540(+)